MSDDAGSATALADGSDAVFPGIRIEAAELRLVELPLLTPFVISTGTMDRKIFPLLILHGEGIAGYAEGVMDLLPDYLDETIAGAWALLSEVLLPAVVGRRFRSPCELAVVLDRWRGNRMAKATLEMAFWDLWAKSFGVPLKVMLGGAGDQVDVGVSLGMASEAQTLQRVAAALDSGYRRIKLKIARGHDIALVAAVRRQYPDIRLTVDANTDYRLSDLPVLRALDGFELDYIEQPLAYDDFHDHARLQAHLHTALCLDESIRSASDARKALELQAARIINIKPGRVGGFMQARAIHEVCAAFDVPVWCGGMLESGIGRAHNTHLATLPNFSKPGDISSASRYFRRDLINEVLETVDGRMPVPMNGPGIGVTLDAGYVESVSSRKQIFKP